MIMRTMLAILFCSLGLCLCSCRPNYTQPVVPDEPLSAERQNFEAHWQASLEVLRRYRFETDPARGAVRDRRSGQIVSLPMVGKSWFEFWRHDAATNFDVAEGSIQTIYRTASVAIAPTAEGSSTYIADVSVMTSRSDRLARTVQNINDAYGLFVMPGSAVTDSTLLRNLVPDDPAQREEMRKGIVELGEDQALSAKLTAEINDLANHRIMLGK